jgi:hypothetical protein
MILGKGCICWDEPTKAVALSPCGHIAKKSAERVLTTFGFTTWGVCRIGFSNIPRGMDR